MDGMNFIDGRFVAPVAGRLRDAGQRRADDFSMTTLAVQYAAVYERLAAERLARREARAAGHRGWGSRVRRVVARMMNAVPGG